MKTKSFTCERRRLLAMPAECVWTWLQNPQLLLKVNPFHHHLEETGLSFAPGSSVVVQHSFCGLYREPRIVRIRAYRRYHVAWGELAATGHDWFPHSQSFTVQPLSPHHCLLINRLRGQFRLTGVVSWLVPWYRWIGPWILELENRTIAWAVVHSETS